MGVARPLYQWLPPSTTLGYGQRVGAGKQRVFFPSSFRNNQKIWSRNVVCSVQLETPLISGKELDENFGCQGVRFAERGNAIAVDLKLRNNSCARIMLNGALITSYKAHMWHGSEEEHLHTVRTRQPNSSRGGIGLRFCPKQQPSSSLLPPLSKSWEVVDVACKPSKYAQISLQNSSYFNLAGNQMAGASLSFRYTVTLSHNSLSSAVVICNTGLVPVEFTGSIVTHFAVSSADSAMIIGLKGCPYRSSLPFSVQPTKSTFWSTLLGLDRMKNTDHHGPSKGTSVDAIGGEEWGNDSGTGSLTRDVFKVETKEYSPTYGGLNRLYSNLPPKFSILDRGMQRSLVVERHGFEEFMISNPGAESNMVDWDNFICMGPAQLSKPIVLECSEKWRAAQILLNPNWGE